MQSWTWIKKRDGGLGAGRSASPQSRMTILVFTGNAVVWIWYSNNAEHAPCAHVECRLGMVEASRCWVKNKYVHIKYLKVCACGNINICKYMKMIILYYMIFLPSFLPSFVRSFFLFSFFLSFFLFFFFSFFLSFFFSFFLSFFLSPSFLFKHIIFIFLIRIIFFDPAFFFDPEKQIDPYLGPNPA